LFAPTVVPPSSPTPAPTAAPVAGLPAAAPIAAPAAAPSTVPIAAPVTVLLVEASLVLVPVCWEANWRQLASSTWNCSKFFPVPGSTMTLGPVGTVTQAVVIKPAAAHTATALIFMVYLARPNLVSAVP
jgi:hypothetical protein